MPRPVKRCPCCHIGNLRMTAHHIFPRNLFGRKNNNEVFLLCWECHRKLHLRIPINTMRPREWYYKVILDFIQEP